MHKNCILLHPYATFDSNAVVIPLVVSPATTLSHVKWAAVRMCISTSLSVCTSSSGHAVNNIIVCYCNPCWLCSSPDLDTNITSWWQRKLRQTSLYKPWHTGCGGRRRCAQKTWVRWPGSLEHMSCLPNQPVTCPVQAAVSSGNLWRHHYSPGQNKLSSPLFEPSEPFDNWFTPCTTSVPLTVSQISACHHLSPQWTGPVATWVTLLAYSNRN